MSSPRSKNYKKLIKRRLTQQIMKQKLKKLFISIQTFTNPNTIAKAVAYITEPANLEAVLKQELRCVDLIPSNLLFVGSDTVKYQVQTFTDLTAGDFDIDTGYPVKGVNASWKTLVLTQDKGNSVGFDNITESEEAMALSIVSVTNRYVKKIKTPTVDTRVFSEISSMPGVHVNGGSALTNTTTYDAITDGFQALENSEINTESLLLYATPTVVKLLKQETDGKGKVSQGEWNGQIDNRVLTVDGAKIVSVPASRFPTGVDFILMHKDAAILVDKFSEIVFFDQIPGFGTRKKQADIGFYYDAFVFEGTELGIYIYQSTKKFAVTLSANGGTGVAMAAQNIAYGATGAALAQMSGYTGPAGLTAFKGWSTTATGAVEYADKANFASENRFASDAVTLYAVWAAA